MADLISRAAAIEAAIDGADDWDGGYNPERERCIREYMAKVSAVDAAPVVRCAYCKHCFDMGSDPMEPYDGESEWYCERFDRDTSAYEIDPYRFYCADGERRNDDAADTW